MLNKWMIAAVTAALFSGADWYAASRVISPRTAAPAATAPATVPSLAASRDANAEADQEPHKAHS